MSVSRQRMTIAMIETYEAIQAFIAEHQYPPSVRNLGALLNLKSTSTVFARLETLKRHGLIAYNPGEPRTLRIVACPVSRSDA